MKKMCVVCGGKPAKFYGYYCDRACAGADFACSGERWPNYSRRLDRNLLGDHGLEPIFVPLGDIVGLDISGFPIHLWQSGQIL